MPIQSVSECARTMHIVDLQYTTCFSSSIDGVVVSHSVQRMVKQARKPRFTEPEISVLIENVETNSQLLFSKLTDVVTNRHKTKTWQLITAKVNACGSCLRTSQEVRKKCVVFRSPMPFIEIPFLDFLLAIVFVRELDEPLVPSSSMQQIHVILCETPGLGPLDPRMYTGNVMWHNTEVHTAPVNARESHLTFVLGIQDHPQ